MASDTCRPFDCCKNSQIYRSGETLKRASHCDEFPSFMPNKKKRKELRNHICIRLYGREREIHFVCVCATNHFVSFDITFKGEISCRSCAFALG
jgi:hypothetical protein